MKIASSLDRVFATAIAALLCAGAALLGGMARGAVGALVGVSLGVLAGYGLIRRAGHLARRRAQLVATPFPGAWRRLLEDTYDHYDRLPAALRTRFEDDLRIFLAEKRITGIGVEVDEELRLLVAASAVTLSLGWPHYGWDELTEVLLYPQSFDRDYSFGGSILGQAHPWGTVILSVPSLRESFRDPDDAYHVGIHEFAHLLDVEHADFDGIPAGVDGRNAETWIAIREREMARMRREESDLDPYGAHDPAEFFAVAVEAFFEAPLALRQEHPKLYAFLSRYFHQDPAHWDDERGLELPS